MTASGNGRQDGGDHEHNERSWELLGDLHESLLCCASVLPLAGHGGPQLAGWREAEYSPYAACSPDFHDDAEESEVPVQVVPLSGRDPRESGHRLTIC